MFFFVASLSFAETGARIGKIEYIRVHDHNTANWEPPVFWFTIEGVTSAGSCQQWGDGKVLFVGDSEQMLSMVMSAYIAGLDVLVNYDDELLTNIYCRARYVTFGNPPPNY